MRRPLIAFRRAGPAVLVFATTFSTALGLYALDAAGAHPARKAVVPTTRKAGPSEGASLRVLDWSLWNVARNYIDPDRISPRRMILAALETVERGVPEVLVSVQDDGARIEIQVREKKRSLELAEDLALWDVGTVVADAVHFVTQNVHLSPREQRDLEYALVNAALSTLDPHSNLLPPRVFEDMKTSTQGSFGGLGIEIGMRDGFITVIRVLDGNPASRVDMRPGDRIVQIDSDSTVTMTLDEAVGLLRGPPGTTVSVYVMREGLASPKRLDITRAIIKLDSVVGTVVRVPGPDAAPHPVGVLQIPRNFAQTTPKELQDKLKEFRKEAVEAVVLDLRGNPGGLLASAVAVADAFLSSGMIVATVGRDRSQRDESYADDRFDFEPVPLVVLVDQTSASASEIVAGSLKNLGRATVIGRQTFGKGSVQALYERRYGEDEVALKLTIAQYLVAGDVSIQGLGVVPDVETIPAYITKKYTEYFGRKRFTRLREADFAEALSAGPGASSSEPPLGPVHFLGLGSVGLDGDKGPKDRDNDRGAQLLLEDPEVKMAARLALLAGEGDRRPRRPRLAEVVETLAAEEDARISQALAKVGVDWTAAPADATGPVRLRAELGGRNLKDADAGTPAPTFVVRAGKTTEIKLAVTNLGTVPAYRVRAITRSDDPYLDEREFLFGRIDPGKTVERAIEVAVGEHERSHIDRVGFSLAAAQEVQVETTGPDYFDVFAKGRKRPAFALAYQIVDDPRYGRSISGNGDGRLQVGERVRFRVPIRNDGEGDALDTWLTLRNNSGSAVFLHRGRHHLETIPRREDKTGKLDLEIKQMPSGGTAEFRILVSDNKVAEVLAEKLHLPVGETGPKARPYRPGLVTVPAWTTIYASADLDRPLARTRSPITVRATGAFGDAVRLHLGEYPGFVPAEKLEPGTSPGKKNLATVYTISPPRIELESVPLRTSEAGLTIRGVARDKQAVRDLYVSVFNPERDRFRGSDKVFYLAADDPTKGELPFEAWVPLAPGRNEVVIHAREDDELEGTKVLWIFRSKGWDDEEPGASRKSAD